MAIGNMLAQFGNQPSLMEGVEQGRRVRTLNDLGQFQLQQGQQQAQRQSQLSDLYKRFAQGDQGALTEIAGVSPEVHMQLQQQMAARSEAERKQAVEQATGLAQQILVARQNPQMQQQLAQASGITPDMYDEVLARASVIPKVYEMMTAKPDSVQKLEYLMSNPEAMAAEQALKRSGSVSVNIGDKPMSLSDLQEVQMPGGGTPPIGATPQQLLQSGATIRPKKTPGQEAVDKEFGKEYVEFKAKGGFADTNKQISQLREVRDMLVKGDTNLTGPVIGRLPSSVAAFAAPQSMAARDAVEEVVQRNLRLILGAQFTEKEGERLIARAYNPALGEQENARRLDRLITQIEEAAKAKQDAAAYFEQNGTLSGWNGNLYTINDFNPEGEAAPTGMTNSGWGPVVVE